MTKAADALRKQLKSMDRASVEVGFFETARYPDGMPVAQVASWNEYGTSGQYPTPARPFMRQTITQEKQNLSNGFAKGMNAVSVGKRTPKEVMQTLGNDLAGKMQSTILDGAFTPNTDSTAKAKGFNSPLRDSGLMSKSVIGVVKGLK